MVISLKYTPNPDAIRFFVDKEWLNIVWECKSVEQAKQSPLTQTLWDLNEVTYMLIGKNFIVINKNKTSSWEKLIPKINEKISDFLMKYETIFPVSKEELNKILKVANIRKQREELSEFEQKIWDVLEEKIQPGLELHGGGVQFIAFESGVLKLRFTGACVGCPSSMYTLEHGIKQVLQYYFPEIERIETL